MAINYVDNNKMYAVICEYLDACNVAEEKGEEIPRIPEYLGKCFIDIANGYAKKPRFCMYAFVEDMKADAIINCVKYIRTFKPEKTKNPFSYFTAAAHNAFLQRVETERDSLCARYYTYQNLQIEEQMNGEHGVCPEELNEISNDFIKNHEKMKQERKERAKAKMAEKKANELSKFYDGDE